MKSVSIGTAAALAAMVSMDLPSLKAIQAAVEPELPSLNSYKRKSKDEQFREQYADKIAECAEFNKTVSTRQVRRHYARIMAKRGNHE